MATRCGLCEHVFVTSQGHAHARFRRALLTKNVMLISAAAADLQHVELDDALRVLLVLAEKGDARYERAAARFAARVTHERRLELAEARYVLLWPRPCRGRRTRSPSSCVRSARPRREPTQDGSRERQIVGPGAGDSYSTMVEPRSENPMRR